MRTHEHIANLIGSYGSTVGIVTMEDVVETLLGAEIVDESDQFPDMQDYAKRKWRMKREKPADPPNQG
jgi:CBS domain containing-hemolysin-like protein